MQGGKGYGATSGVGKLQNLRVAVQRRWNNTVSDTSRQQVGADQGNETLEVKWEPQGERAAAWQACSWAAVAWSWGQHAGWELGVTSAQSSGQLAALP